jgi:mannosyltransferase OCH1-like enzyme
MPHTSSKPILHQIWLNGLRTPKLLYHYRKSWCSQFNIKLWTPADLPKLRYPNYEKIIGRFDKRNRYRFLADLYRYQLLVDYGGLYTDIDMQMTQNVRRVFDRYDVCLTQHPNIKALPKYPDKPCNGVLWSKRPNHPFFVLVMQTINENISKHKKSSSVNVMSGWRVLDACGKRVMVHIARYPFMSNAGTGKFNFIKHNKAWSNYIK